MIFAISFKLRRSKSISYRVNIRGVGAIPSLRLSRAIEGVAETFAPPGFEVLPLSLSEFMEQGPSSSICGQVYLRGSACTIRTATSPPDGRRSRPCFDTLQPFVLRHPSTGSGTELRITRAHQPGAGQSKLRDPGRGSREGSPSHLPYQGATAGLVGWISRRRHPTYTGWFPAAGRPLTLALSQRERGFCSLPFDLSTSSRHRRLRDRG